MADQIYGANPKAVYDGDPTAVLTEIRLQVRDIQRGKRVPTTCYLGKRQFVGLRRAVGENFGSLDTFHGMKLWILPMNGVMVI